jgi:hypothetical protein
MIEHFKVLRLVGVGNVPAVSLRVVGGHSNFFANNYLSNRVEIPEAVGRTQGNYAGE